jgi:ubiquinone biosynthesis protein COQ9
MNTPIDLTKAILDTALQLADNRSWEALRLHDIASELGISLAQIQQHYQQKDDLVEAWYDRADANMLKASEDSEFSTLDKATRLHRLIMTWLDTLATHKTVSRDMLLYKLEPAHIHLQMSGILRISRTVQWLLEAAQSKTTHLQRIFEEVHLTAIYLVTFSYWMQDASDHQNASRDFLWHRLKQHKLK